MTRLIHNHAPILQNWLFYPLFYFAICRTTTTLILSKVNKPQINQNHIICRLSIFLSPKVLLLCLMELISGLQRLFATLILLLSKFIVVPFYEASSILILLNLPDATIIDMLILCLSAQNCNAYFPITLLCSTQLGELNLTMMAGFVHLLHTNLLTILPSTTFLQKLICQLFKLRFASFLAYFLPGQMSQVSTLRYITSLQHSETGWQYKEVKNMQQDCVTVPQAAITSLFVIQKSSPNIYFTLLNKNQYFQVVYGIALIGYFSFLSSSSDKNLPWLVARWMKLIFEDKAFLIDSRNLDFYYYFSLNFFAFRLISLVQEIVIQLFMCQQVLLALLLRSLGCRQRFGIVGNLSIFFLINLQLDLELNICLDCDLGNNLFLQSRYLQIANTLELELTT